MLKLLQLLQRPLRRQMRLGAAQSLSHNPVEDQGNEADGGVRLDPCRQAMKHRANFDFGFQMRNLFSVDQDFSWLLTTENRGFDQRKIVTHARDFQAQPKDEDLLSSKRQVTFLALDCLWATMCDRAIRG